jgi:hypothetical protein
MCKGNSSSNRQVSDILHIVPSLIGAEPLDATQGPHRSSSVVQSNFVLTVIRPPKSRSPRKLLAKVPDLAVLDRQRHLERLPQSGNLVVLSLTDGRLIAASNADQFADTAADMSAYLSRLPATALTFCPSVATNRDRRASSRANWLMGVYWKSFVALNTVWTTPQASGTPTNPQARARCHHLVFWDIASFPEEPTTFRGAEARGA